MAKKMKVVWNGMKNKNINFYLEIYFELFYIRKK